MTVVNDRGENMLLRASPDFASIAGNPTGSDPGANTFG